MAFALLFLFRYYPPDGKVRILLTHQNVTLATSTPVFERKNFCQFISISFSQSVRHTVLILSALPVAVLGAANWYSDIAVKEHTCGCRSGNELGIEQGLNSAVLS